MSIGRFSKNLLFLAVIACAVLSSCVPAQKVQSSVKTVDISHGGVIQKPVIVDISIGQTKVHGTASGMSSMVEMVKNEAVKDALSKAGNADVMIEPDFTISESGFSVDVEVRGYPGTYTNFRTIEDGDNAWLKSVESIHQAKVYDASNKQTTVSEQKSNKSRGLWGIVGGGALLLLLIIAAMSGG